MLYSDRTMALELFIGTSNSGKIHEIQEALRGVPVSLRTPSDWKSHLPAPIETGTTFLINAMQKARHYHDLTHLPTIGEDSGIHVAALEGELGIHTRRWGAGPLASDQEWIHHFLSRMKNETNRLATFVCSIVFIDAEGEAHSFEGKCEGEITDSLESEYLSGLPISACFKPQGCDRVFSSLSGEEKNRVSHRGRAMKSFIAFLQDQSLIH